MLVFHEREHGLAVVREFVGHSVDGRIRHAEGLQLLRGALGGVLEDAADPAGGDVLLQHGLDAGLGPGVGGMGVHGERDDGGLDAVGIDNDGVAAGWPTGGLGRESVEAGAPNLADEPAGALTGNGVSAGELDDLTAARVGNDSGGFGQTEGNGEVGALQAGSAVARQEGYTHGASPLQPGSGL